MAFSNDKWWHRDHFRPAKNDGWQLVVADDAGLFDAPAAPDKDESSNGLGMNLVDRRIKAHYGDQFGAGAVSARHCHSGHY